MITREVVFRDRYGLHPRAARQIRDHLASAQAAVRLIDVDGSAAAVDAASMLALISSGIRAGDHVRVTAEGPDEALVAQTIGDLLEAGICHPMGHS